MPKTALIVDDSVSMRQIVAFTLAKAGFQTVEACDGQAGLRCLEANRIDVVITDLNMPVMNGIEFILEIRRRPGSKFLPVLMLTTESHEAKKMQGKAAGATGWIVKPFKPEKLVEVIAKVLP